MQCPETDLENKVWDVLKGIVYFWNLVVGGFQRVPHSATQS